MGNNKTLDPIFEPYVRLIETISTQFGSNCQSSLYDMRQHPVELIYVAGSVIKKDLGSPLPARVFRHLEKDNHQSSGRLLFTSTSPDGLRLSSSVTMIHDADKNLIGCICIDLCIESLIASIDVLQNFCKFDNEVSSSEELDDDVFGLVDSIITDVLREPRTFPKADKKSERLRIVGRLEKKGVFLVKGTVELVSTRLNISKYTLYSYLDQLKNAGGVAEISHDPRDAGRS